MGQVGILIIDDDIASQRALKNILDSEGWRVRISPVATHALAELASGEWNLVIVNVALTDLRGAIFATLRDLALADSAAIQTGTDENPAAAAEQEGDNGWCAAERPAGSRSLRVLFLVPPLAAREAEPVLEADGLPYIPKPYHLHDFLEKVSDLLLEAGAIDAPIRSMRDFVGTTRRRRSRGAVKETKRGAMFAMRDDYVMTEEELAEFERQEEEERKRREKEQKERENLG